MDPATLDTLITIGGAATATTILSEVIFRALGPRFDKARFGALLAVAFGIVVTEVATFALGLGTRQDIATAAFTGLFAGASSIGIHDVVTDVAAPS